MRGLRFHRGEMPDLPARYARARLLAEVLGIEPAPGVAGTNPWLPFALFDESSFCAANVDVAILPLTVTGTIIPVAGIRSVAVAPERRGQGLFRKLIQEALAWCDQEGASLALLYTEEPDLYRRFGFEPVAQHAFAGTAPAPRGDAGSRRVEIATAEDRDLVRRLVETRGPMSSRCALGIDATQFVTNLGKDGGYDLAYLPALDALLVFEQDGDTLVITDIVAAAMPDAARLLGAIGLRPKRLKVLFPPDRLGWQGTPTQEDTGLMIRGVLPAALTAPFMLPPTVEF